MRTSPERVPSTHFRKHYNALLENVRVNGAEYIISRSGIPIAKVVPVERRRAKREDLP